MIVTGIRVFGIFKMVNVNYIDYHNQANVYWL